jgi:hypothetical protein
VGVKAKVTIYSEDKIGGEAAKVRVFPTRKNCLFFLTGLKMVVGVGFCKIKVDSNFLLVLKIKCTKFHQDRSKTADLHTKYTNKQTFSIIYRCPQKKRRVHSSLIYRRILIIYTPCYSMGCHR